MFAFCAIFGPSVCIIVGKSVPLAWTISLFMNNKLFPLLSLAVCMAGCGTKSSDDMEQRIDQLYRNMSNAERIAQLRSGYMNEYFDEQGNLDSSYEFFWPFK